MKVLDQQVAKGKPHDITLVLKAAQLLLSGKGMYSYLPKYSLASFISASNSREERLVWYFRMPALPLILFLCIVCFAVCAWMGSAY